MNIILKSREASGRGPPTAMMAATAGSIRTHRRTFALALVDLQVARGVLHDGGAHYGGSENRMPAMAELAGDRGLNEIRDAWGKIFVALAEIDELDGAANVFQREPQVGAIEPIIIDAFDIELVRELHDLARDETRGGRPGLQCRSRSPALSHCLEQLALGLAATVERL